LVGRASKRSEVLTVHTTEAFDALVSDLHLPPEQDGFIVLGATRHSHPKAWTVIVTDSPAGRRNGTAIFSQAGERIVESVPAQIGREADSHQARAT